MSVHQVGSVLLFGSPNSGKTTLFSWLTGRKVRPVNYAGSTVECHVGMTLPNYGEPLEVIDTPGVYSLQPHGPDERVLWQALEKTDQVTAVVVVVDGTQLNRQLYLVRQAQELKRPIIVAVTMMDLVRKAGRQVDLNLLGNLVDATVVGVDGRLGSGVSELVDAIRTRGLERPEPIASVHFEWDEERIEREIRVVEDWARQVVVKSPSDRALEEFRELDRWLLHPVWGVVGFLVIMSALFSSIFWLAAPMMDAVDSGFAWLAAETLYTFGENIGTRFLADGLIAGVGSVLVFVPQIFILFLGLNLLEDTGYLARAATIVDRPLQMIGLSGRSFVPLLSGFACAVPAVMAARNVRSPRERWILTFIVPLMTCSARLPVYALLLTLLFWGRPAWWAGIALTALYLAGVASGVVASFVLHKVTGKSEVSPLLMEIPVYRRPKLKTILLLSWRRTDSYIRRAGPTIFVFVILLWMGANFPYKKDATPTEQLQSSVVGYVGRFLEPVVEPMGSDWRVGIGLISAFVAREAFVSSVAVVFNLSEDDEQYESSLLNQLRNAKRADGSTLFGPASVAALLVFFVIALQCLSTTGVVWREMGSWKFAVAQLLVLNTVAYLVAVAMFQVLTL